MPTPVSRTSMRARRPSGRSSSRARTAISPREVNFTALFSRLTSTCRTRPGSPAHAASSARSVSQLSSRPFSSAGSAIMVVTSSMTSRSEKSTCSSSSLPASIFEKSRMSLMTERSRLADVRATSTYRFCRASSCVRESRSTMPMTPFSGVRSSWLMLATNALFAAVAAIASSLARSSCRSVSRRVWSARKRSLTSRARTSPAVTLPSWSCIGERTDSTRMRSPSFRTAAHSTGGCRKPSLACSIVTRRRSCSWGSRRRVSPISSSSSFE